MTNASPKKPPRRWFRFCLLTLLVFAVVLSVPLGWFVMNLRRAARQRAAVEAIEKTGKQVFYDYQWCVDMMLPRSQAKPSTPAWLRQLLGDDFFCDVIQVAYPSTTFGDDDLIHVKNFSKLRRLDLNGAAVTDAGLEQLMGLTSLEHLYLSGTQVTDAGLSHLKGLTTLELLDLSNTQTTDVGMECLKGLDDLESLNLSGTQVTDATMEYLEGLTGLEVVDLSDVQITDAGLEHLRGLDDMEWVDLRGTRVTEEGVQKLEKALPDCAIRHSDEL